MKIVQLKHWNKISLVLLYGFAALAIYFLAGLAILAEMEGYRWIAMIIGFLSFILTRSLFSYLGKRYMIVESLDSEHKSISRISAVGFDIQIGSNKTRISWKELEYGSLHQEGLTLGSYGTDFLVDNSYDGYYHLLNSLDLNGVSEEAKRFHFYKAEQNFEFCTICGQKAFENKKCHVCLSEKYTLLDGSSSDYIINNQTRVFPFRAYDISYDELIASKRILYFTTNPNWKMLVNSGDD